MEPARLAEVARRLRARADAVNAVVWFTAALGGYPPVALEGQGASIAGRAACLGPVAPEIAASLLAPIEPAAVIARLREAWAVTTPAELLAAREQTILAWLERVVGDLPADVVDALAVLDDALDASDAAAHPMFAALRALPRPSHPLARLQRAAEMVRERRGDSHRNAWSAAGLDGIELNVLTDAYRSGSTGRAPTTTGGWPRAAQAAARHALWERGWLDGEGAITDAGRAARDAIEVATDVGDASLVAALGARIDAVIASLGPVARTIVEARPNGF